MTDNEAMDENSCIKSFYGKVPDTVVEILQHLPVRLVQRGKVTHFLFKHGTCDGNTAHHLEQIITHLIALNRQA